MTGCRTLSAAVFVVLVVSFSGGTAMAFDDTHGREWGQLYTTTGLSWDQVATVCPRDGVTPCSGTVGGRDLTRWVWATDAQVVEMMSEYAPDLATADPPSLSGPDYFLQAHGFLSVMRWTTFTSLT